MVLYAIAMVIFFFVYHPLGMFGETVGIPEPISVQTYMLLLLLIGYVVLIASRVLLYRAVAKHPEWTLGNALLWVTVEFLVVDFLITGLSLALGNNDIVTFMRMLSRVTVDFVGLYMVPMLTVALISVTIENGKKYTEVSRSYTDLKSHADTLEAELVTAREEKDKQYQESLAMKERLESVQNSIAAFEQADAVEGTEEGDSPFLDMLRFKNRTGDFDFALPRENVLYIETVDNYVSVNFLDAGRVNNRIIRNTMKAMEEQMQQEGFVRCHRQYLVNKQNIKSVSREKEGLMINLRGCDRALPVSKTYAALVT